MIEKLPYSGRTSAYEHKQNSWQDKDISNVKSAVRKQWILDAQWSNCPVEVENQVKDLWRYYDCGNDHYIIKTTIEELSYLETDGAVVERWHEKPENISYEEADRLEHEEGKKVCGWIEGPFKVDYVIQYLREMGVGDKEEVWIHWWW